MILGIIFPPAILLLDFRLGDEASGHTNKENEDGGSKDEDSKSSKVATPPPRTPSLLCPLSTAMTACLSQDAASNVDATSKKGDEEEEQSKTKRRTPVVKKIFEFYNAPFTKFWFNTVSLDILDLNYKRFKDQSTPFHLSFI